MKTISFALQKGGVGKTSISVSTAAELAKYGKTLLIDADPQGNASGWLISELEYELADILLNKEDVKNAIYQTTVDNLFILPTTGLDGKLREYSETKALTHPNDVKHLMKKISALDFEYCVIDTSPAFGALEKECFIASDEIVAVLQLDIFSTDGFTTFSDSLVKLREAFDLEADHPLFNKLVFNAKDDRIQHQQILLEQFSKMKGFKRFVVPVDQSFKKAQSAQTIINNISGVKKETVEAIEKIAGSIK